MLKVKESEVTMADLQVGATGSNQPLRKPEVREGNPSGGGQSGAVDFSASRASTSDEALEASGWKLTKEDVKAAQNEDGERMRTSARTKEIVANIHNKYASEILEMAGENEELRKIAQKHIKALPKASTKRDLLTYRVACQAKVDAFRADAQRLGLANSLFILDENAADRAALAEKADAARANEIKDAVAATGEHVIEAVNTHTDEVGAGIKQTVRSEGQKTRGTVRKEGAATRAEVINTGNSVVRRVTQNTSAIVGVDAPGYTETDEETGNRLLDNGEAVDGGAVVLINSLTHIEADRVIKKVNEHTTQESKKIQLTQQQTQVLQAKLATITNMLMNEVNEKFPGPGHYRDVTVKWLGSAADRVMADSELTFEKKQEALDELIRMVDEENVISDADKAEFEGKYFYDTRAHRHI